MATVTTQASAAVFRPGALKSRFLSGSSGKLNREVSFKPVTSSSSTSFKVEAKKGEWLPGLASPGYLTGSLPGDNGFDPLGLAEDPENLRWYVQAELVNGRWAMLGVVGMLLPEVFTKIGIINAPQWYDAGKAEYFASSSTLFVIEFILFHYVEIRRWQDIKNPGSVNQSITNFAATMLRAIGMSADDAFSYTMGIQSVNIFATGIAIALMGSVGRRTFYLWGSASIGFCMLVVGIMGFAITDRNKVAIPTAVFLIFVQIAFKISLGPTTYVIAGEMASSRVRAQTIVIGRTLYVCGQIAVQQLNPRMLNNDPTAWNWGARTGMFYFGFCLLWVVWIFFFLPETKDRSFAEIDYLFKKKTPARKFRGAQVDLFEFMPEDGSQEKLGAYGEKVEHVVHSSGI